MKRKNLKRALKDKRYNFYYLDKGMKINKVLAYKRISKQSVKDKIKFKLPTENIIVVEQ